MTMLRILTSMATAAMTINLVMATSYTVGGPNGQWDTSSNVQAWASSQSIFVGDNLIFEYTPNHDVTEVTKQDYDSCQITNPIQTYVGGTTVIPLTSPGTRYFICGTSGHCSQGMKVEIDTLATSATPPASTDNPAASSPAPAPIVNPPRLFTSPAISPIYPGFPSPIGSPPPPSLPSSATKVNMMAGSTMAIRFILMVLLTL